MAAKAKTLFLASNPADTQLLQLDKEIRLITEKIRLSEYRDVLDLVSMWAVRPDDLLQGLNQHKPDIVHFSGHGSKEGEIILINDNSSTEAVSASALKMLFKTLKGNIRLVVLNACFSKIQAEAIAEVIDCVIGMNTAIGDNAAIVFAASFYRALGFGHSIKNSFDQGVTSLMLHGIPEENTPELIVREGVDPDSIIITATHKKDDSHEPVEHNPVKVDQSKILPALIENFTLDDLKIICFTLGVDPDSISGGSTHVFAMNMIIYFKNRDKMELLAAECKKRRPNIKF